MVGSGSLPVNSAYAMIIPETIQINMTYSLIFLLDTNPLIIMTIKYPTKMGAEILPAVIDPIVTTSQSVSRSRLPASHNFEKRMSVNIPIQIGMTKIARIRERLVSVGDTNGMAMAKIKVSIATEAATR